MNGNDFIIAFIGAALTAIAIVVIHAISVESARSACQQSLGVDRCVRYWGAAQ